MKRVELLAPAGDMACFKAAINAGADAVYLGGEAYGARAYASNFSKEELCGAISYAHIFGVKVYLTVNTLVKEREFNGLCDFIRPYYEMGLDGVIIQDFGVLKTLKEHFPELELHASTQMCVAGSYGAKLLKQYGVSRVVPARELSLEEICEIKDIGIEVETFIHGAMCYSYSGQCLFSSFLGGRSGNRGRCAGPCRLPYSAFGQKEVYPLSLKDMCTLPILHELLDAGIDSFKIEGRMKNPYYVAGVTAIYRKYIDLYIKSKEENIPYKVDKKDMDILRNLYVRTELETGYYHRHNGPEMVTLQKPGYITGDEKQFAWIKEAYLERNKKISLYCELKVGIEEVLSLTVWDLKGHSVTVKGNQSISVALNRPATIADIEKQLRKTNDTPFDFESISVIMEEDVFIPVKELNELRRHALHAMEEILTADERCIFTKNPAQVTGDEIKNSQNDTQRTDSGIHISVCTVEQLCGVQSAIEDLQDERVTGIELDFTLLEKWDKVQSVLVDLKELKPSLAVYLCMPRVGRKAAIEYLKKYLKNEYFKQIQGFYCGSLDVLSYLSERLQNLQIDMADIKLFADSSLYTCNREAVAFLQELGVSGFVGSYELNRHEWKELLSSCDTNKNTKEMMTESLIYGYIPFMQTAGCIKKTFSKCDGSGGITWLTDRIGKKLPVVNVCQICENTVYNSLPLDLTKEMPSISCDTYRISFTIEDSKLTKNILENILSGKKIPVEEFTKGHFKKGVE